MTRKITSPTWIGCKCITRLLLAFHQVNLTVGQYPFILLGEKWRMGKIDINTKPQICKIYIAPVNLLTPMSDQDRISPHSINIISTIIRIVWLKVKRIASLIWELKVNPEQQLHLPHGGLLLVSSNNHLSS